MTSATNDAVFDLIQRAMLQVANHSMDAGCDDLPLAEAFAALDKARRMVRPMSLVKKPGYRECEGVYMQDHRMIPGSKIGICKYCHSELRTTSYGKNLREHYVAILPSLEQMDAEPSKLRGSLVL